VPPEIRSQARTDSLRWFRRAQRAAFKDDREREGLRPSVGMFRLCERSGQSQSHCCPPPRDPTMSSDKIDPATIGVGSKRVTSKLPPKLPLSVFKESIASVKLSDPSTLFPGAIIDANVAIPLEEWKRTAGDMLNRTISGVVLVLQTGQEAGDDILNASSDIPVTAVITPTHLADRGISKLPPHFASSKIPIALSISFSSTPSLAEDIRLALSTGHVVDLDVPWNAIQAESDREWDSLEETLGNAVEGLAADGKVKPIVLGNLLPPPHSLTVPIIQLLRHPTYEAYQRHISSLSLLPNTYLKFLPPSWREPTPPSPGPGATFSGTSGESVQNNLKKEEWKRRVKMYLGPALDAFGFARVIFGTSPSPSSSAPSTAHDWYVLVREVVAELAVDQEGVNAIFSGTASSVYPRQELI